MTLIKHTGIGLLVFGLATVFPIWAHAANTQLVVLKCANGSGGISFNGIVQPVTPLTDTRRLISDLQISYQMAISNEPYVIIARPSLEMLTGITLSQCRGPYAKVFEKITVPGSLSCDLATVEAVMIGNKSDADILSAFGLAPLDVACSIILPTKNLGNVPRGRQ